MTVAKVTEITAESKESFEAAIREGIARASKTIHNMKAAWVKEESVVIDGDKISKFRVTLKITFVLD